MINEVRLDECLNSFKSKILKVAKRERIVIRVDGFADYNDLMKGAEVQIYHPEFGKVNFYVSGVFDTYIRKLLSEGKFIGVSSEYLYKECLKQGMSINIHGLEYMVYTYKGYTKYSGWTIGTGEFIYDSLIIRITNRAYELYNYLKANIDWDEYLVLVGALKQVYKANLYNVKYDVDTHIIHNKLEELESKANDILERNKDNIRGDGYSAEFKHSNGRYYRISTMGVSRLANEEIDDEFLKELLKYRKFNRSKTRLKGYLNTRINLGRELVLYSSAIKGVIREIPEAIKAGSQHYYIGVYGHQINDNYSEYRNSGIDTCGTDVNVRLASLVYNKSFKDITEEQSNEAKKVLNTVRICVALGEAVDVELRKRFGSIYYKYKKYLGHYTGENLRSYHADFIKALYELGVKTSDMDYDDIVIHTIFSGTVVFKISNRVNPYIALRILCDSFLEGFGVGIYNMFSVGNSYEDIRQGLGKIESKDGIIEFNGINIEYIHGICDSHKDLDTVECIEMIKNRFNKAK